MESDQKQNNAECSLFTGRQDDCESDLNPGCEYCADSGVCTLVADAIPCEGRTLELPLSLLPNCAVALSD